MSERWSVASRLRPAVTYLTVWLSASVFAVVVWASAAGAGAIPGIAAGGTVVHGDDRSVLTVGGGVRRARCAGDHHGVRRSIV
jgi:hypothetical protein